MQLQQSPATQLSEQFQGTSVKTSSLICLYPCLYASPPCSLASRLGFHFTPFAADIAADIIIVLLLPLLCPYSGV